MPENIKQTFIFDVRLLHREQNGGKFESKHQIYLAIFLSNMLKKCSKSYVHLEINLLTFLLVYK